MALYHSQTQPRVIISFEGLKTKPHITPKLRVGEQGPDGLRGKTRIDKPHGDITLNNKA